MSVPVVEGRASSSAVQHTLADRPRFAAFAAIARRLKRWIVSWTGVLQGP